MDNNTVYEWILQSTFTVSAREKSLQSAKPHLSTLVHPGDEILDLCCGSGFVSFWFEEQGAKVTGIDLAPYMIALAKEETVRRKSSIQFIEADIFALDLGQECYDLVSCFGNSISDFPLSDLAKLGMKIASVLKPGGRLVLDYHDGSYEFMQGRGAREGVYQEAPERVTFRYQGYLPEIGAFVHTIRNEARGEEYDRKGYIYTVPTVHLALRSVLNVEQHILLDANHFMDVFGRQNN
ncbi:MAG TPA: class I SAM-dependent methyltransferase [Anaerolineales bacterium]|nr:class I SAM-dependent methyltransferase [Anaerolineales bacterium]